VTRGASEDGFDRFRALEPLVIAALDKFDQDRRLPNALVDAMAEAGLFRLWLPRALGGEELPPTALLAAIEELARWDGSFGWCATIAAGYGRLAGAMQQDAAREVFQTGRGILAGSLNPTGKAVVVPGGYRVTGRWTYGSFIDHADWVLGNCVTEDASGPREAEDGGPDFRLCLFPKATVEVFDIWHVTGLRATGSNDYQVKDLFVPERFAIGFAGFHPAPIQPGLLYAVPLPSTFVSCIAVVLLGIARAALDTLVEIAASKTTAGAGPVLRDRGAAQAELARAEALLRSGRAWLFEELDKMWADTLHGDAITTERRALVRLAAVNSGQNAIAATDIAWRLAGGASLFLGNRLERCFRDIHTAGQHVVMSPQAYLEPIGRVLFGLPPGMARF
jgi:alkylation response protein AidB-like acyl-CoA dehydrogenase